MPSHYLVKGTVSSLKWNDPRSLSMSTAWDCMDEESLGSYPRECSVALRVRSSCNGENGENTWHCCANSQVSPKS